MMKKRLLIAAAFLTVTLGLFGASKAIPVKGFPPGNQDAATLNAGLPASEYGYHPDNDGSWGESWSIQVVNERGDFVYALMSISNYAPFQKFGGTVDLFYYPANGKKFEAHKEYKSKLTSAKKSGVSLDIGGNRFSGTHPNYRLNASIGDLVLDLKFKVETASLRIGQDFIRFGEKQDRRWNLTALGPRATCTGSITVAGEKLNYGGLAYFDHGWSTYKIYEFSRRWHVIRILEKDLSINLLDMNLRNNFSPNRSQALFITVGDKVIANSGAVKLTPSGTFKHAASGLSLPQSYSLAYDRGGVKLNGTVKMTKLIEGLNVLERLSPILRKLIQTLVTDPWQFRFIADADLTLEHDGQTRKITGPVAGGEVHHYK
jgi:hypothetical protein